jgi:hypothetical protein
MATEPPAWPRPHFTPGGGDAFLYYVVFGAFDLSRPPTRAKYRTAGAPAWLSNAGYDRAKHPEVFAEYQSGKLWDVLTRDTPVTAAEAERSPQCVRLRAEVPDPPSLDYFRDVVGVVAWLLDAGGVAVYDPQMFWLWAPDEWRDEVFAPDEPLPDRHTTIMVSEEAGGTSWYHTRGMRKYGRPDLSVRGVGAAHADGVTLMLERFVELQALGGVIPDGEEVRMQALPPGGVCRHGGSHDDPDFNNVHVEVAWPPGALV